MHADKAFFFRLIDCLKLFIKETDNNEGITIKNTKLEQRCKSYTTFNMKELKKKRKRKT